MAEPQVRIWNLTADDSSDLPAPATVTFLRQALSEERPFGWDDLVAGAPLVGIPSGFLDDPNDDSVPLWVLCALYARHVYPGRKVEAYQAFGHVLAELIAEIGIGPFSPRQKTASLAVRDYLDRLRGRVDITDLQRISGVTDILADALL